MTLVILTRYMYNLAKKWKIPGAETNPASGVELFEENKKRERFLNAEEVQRLVAAVNIKKGSGTISLLHRANLSTQPESRSRSTAYGCSGEWFSHRPTTFPPEVGQNCP